ncbi:M48 family metalloprotease, partial [Escherichia sp. TWPC-MK]
SNMDWVRPPSRLASFSKLPTSDVNAWAMANGCVRVYSGLMDMMNDNEIEGVLGHELGHVALGHSLAEMKTPQPACG